MSIRTIALTLRPTAAERVALARLQEQFNAACNYVSGVAWEAQEFNKIRLQRLVYGDVRAAYGLMAQHTIRAIAVVADAYQRDHDTKRAFRADAAVVLDTPRLYRVTHNRARITTLDGRLNVALGIGGYQRRMLTDAVKLAEADLIRDRKGRWRLMISAHYADPPPLEADGGVMGVDLGRTDIAVTSEGAAFSGTQITAVRDRYTRVRRSLQRRAAQGTRSTRRRARAVHKRIAGRERRFQRDINHGISRHIVDCACGHGQALACEDLTGIRQRTNTQRRTKTERRRSNSWAFAQLRLFLAYKCQAAGVPFVLVDPAYTSQMCHGCFVLGDRAGKRFMCRNSACAWWGDADYNGARNIARVGASVMCPGGPPLCCLYQPDGRATTSPGAFALGT